LKPQHGVAGLVPGHADAARRDRERRPHERRGHLLAGLYDAKLDHQPVLAITGLPYHDLLSTYTQQDVELDRVFMDVARYDARVMAPTHVESVADLACRTALAYRSVAHLSFPVDLQSAPAERKGSKRNVPGHTSHVMARSARLPDSTDLQRAADLLNAGQRVAILAGAGALDATDGGSSWRSAGHAPIIR
jgi:pyruvate dehydrogenase (quinone)/pyruvate oxidase